MKQRTILVIFTAALLLLVAVVAAQFVALEKSSVSESAMSSGAQATSTLSANQHTTTTGNSNLTATSTPTSTATSENIPQTATSTPKEVNYTCPSATSALSTSSDKYAGQITFLRNGDIWAMDPDTKALTQITNTSGSVSRYIFSPTGEYIANIESGLIVITRTVDGATMRTIKPADIPVGKATSIYLLGWKSTTAIAFEADEPGDYLGTFEYNIPQGTISNLEFGDWHISAQYPDQVHYALSSCGSFMVYALGSELHIVDAATKHDELLYAAPTFGLFAVSVSPNNEHIAFVWVENAYLTQNLRGVEFDHAMVYDHKPNQPRVLTEYLQPL